jgi:hypothetical protein
MFRIKSHYLLAERLRRETVLRLRAQRIDGSTEEVLFEHGYTVHLVK